MRLENFISLDELENKINNFFIDCDNKDEPYTMAGLALELGVNRVTLLRWRKGACRKKFDCIFI